MRVKSLLGLSVVPVTLLSLTGCVSGSPSSTPSTAPSAAPSSAAGSGTLDFATVERVTAPILQQDPNCAFGQWNDNSTGVKEEFRSGVKMFKQFDCETSARMTSADCPSGSSSRCSSSSATTPRR